MAWKVHNDCKVAFEPHLYTSSSSTSTSIGVISNEPLSGNGIGISDCMLSRPQSNNVPICKSSRGVLILSHILHGICGFETCCPV